MSSKLVVMVVLLLGKRDEMGTDKSTEAEAYRKGHYTYLKVCDFRLKDSEELCVICSRHERQHTCFWGSYSQVKLKVHSRNLERSTMSVLLMNADAQFIIGDHPSYIPRVEAAMAGGSPTIVEDCKQGTWLVASVPIST